MPMVGAKQGLLKVFAPFRDFGQRATWRSGYAAVCKTVYPGSIPGVASTASKRNTCRTFTSATALIGSDRGSSGKGGLRPAVDIARMRFPE
jgi:hypothetical protein